MSTLRLLSSAEIFATEDIAYKIVPVPEWGSNVGVRVRGLMASERDHLESAMIEVRRNKAEINARGFLSNFRAKLVALATVDEAGNPIFSERDVERLGTKNSAAIGRIAEAIQKLSAMSDEDVEEIVGNSESDPSGDSP